jgi:hypothetical protein
MWNVKIELDDLQKTTPSNLEVGDVDREPFRQGSGFPMQKTGKEALGSPQVQ